MFNVSKEVKLKDVNQQMICKRIKEDNVEIVSISSVLDREIVVTILGPFKKEIGKVVNDQLIRSSKKSESYSTIVESLYEVEISSLYFELSL